jgi:acyl carrier protein
LTTCIASRSIQGGDVKQRTRAARRFSYALSLMAHATRVRGIFSVVMHERVRVLIAEVFGLSPQQVPADASPELLDEWTSMHHVELMLALEDEFGIWIDPELAPALVSVSAIANFLERQAGVGAAP